MKNSQSLQGMLSVGALLCLVVGWFQILPPHISDIVYKQLFYILIGASFVLQAQMLPNKKVMYAMYVAAVLCIIGAFLPIESQAASIKTIGLFAGVIISLFNRRSVPRD